MNAHDLMPSLALAVREPSLEHELSSSIAPYDFHRTQAEYFRQGEFLVLEDFLSIASVARYRRAADALVDRVHRGGVAGFKRAGAVSAFDIETHAPELWELYRSPALRAFVSRLVDLPLLQCPPEDPHACALYRYDREGDHIGFHYDTSFYQGLRFTVLLGLVDDSSARLVCRLHTRDRGRPVEKLEVATRPGTMVLFHGDKLRHAVSPLGVDEERVVLSLQYVTSTEMGVCGRLVSGLKDAWAYFGARSYLKSLGRRRTPGLLRATSNG